MFALISNVKRIRADKYFLIYQYGKVGSTSLSKAIDGAANIHDLYGLLTCPPGFKVRYKFFYRKIVFPIGRFVKRALIRSRKNVDIIIPLRKPFERNISMFFQDLPYWYVEYFRTNGKAYDKGEGVSLLKEIFVNEFPHDFCDEWFEKEFSRFTGITLDDIDFDKKKGFCEVSRGRYRCLFIYSNILSKPSGKAVLEKFCGQPVEIFGSNRGERKWYATGYQAFLSDKDFIEKYSNRLEDNLINKIFF